MLWHTDDDAPDGVWIDASGGIPLFSSSASLDRFAVRLGITLASDPPILHDLDVITQWLSDPRRDTVDCDAFLAAWNLFSDVAVTVGAELPDQGEPANTIYKKLFWGCNPPSVTPPGSYYVPEWTPAELPTLRQILAFGFSLMRPRLKPVP